MTKLHHILKISWFDIFPTEHFTLRLQVYLWFPEFLKVEWAAEPSVIRPLSGVGRRVAGVNTLHLLTVMLDISKSSVLYRSHRAVER